MVRPSVGGCAAARRDRHAGRRTHAERGAPPCIAENDGKAIAVVTHGSAIRGALTIAHGFPPEKMNGIGWGDNTCVARLDFADDGSIDVVL